MIQKVEISWRHREQEGAIPVEVVYSKRRTIGLEIKADGHVYARVPERIPNQYVMDFSKGAPGMDCAEMVHDYGAAQAGAVQAGQRL